eukprot:5474436-Prymnesium_polylepis.1
MHEANGPHDDSARPRHPTRWRDAESDLGIDRRSAIGSEVRRPENVCQAEEQLERDHPAGLELEVRHVVIRLSEDDDVHRKQARARAGDETEDEALCPSLCGARRQTALVSFGALHGARPRVASKREDEHSHEANKPKEAAADSNADNREEEDVEAFDPRCLLGDLVR